jgi:hypothetical protein
LPSPWPKNGRLRISKAMTANDFRSLALSLPEAVEMEHMGHPDFRVGGKIFASLAPDASWGMVKLKPDAQASFMRSEPAVFRPAQGAWGRQGCTLVQLSEAREETVREALAAAWRNTAPAKLMAKHNVS